MDEHGPFPQLCEERVGVLRREARGDDRHPRLFLQLRPVERDELVQLGQVEQAGDEVDLVVLDAEAALQLREHPRGAGTRDLDAHRLPEPPSAKLELDGLQQVVGLVGDREVRVTRDAEERALDDLHHREERLEEVPDHALQRDEEPPRPDREEPRQQLRHLDAREPLLPGLAVAHEEAEAQREHGDVRERLARADRQRRQHREDLRLEDSLQLLELGAVEVVDLGDHDPLLRQGGLQVALPELRLLGNQLERAFADRPQRRSRRQAVARCPGHSAGHLVHQAGDADHEELVHVAGEDRAEVGPLEQRHGVVARDVEHARVEVELRQLPVQEPEFLGFRSARGQGAYPLVLPERRGLQTGYRVLRSARRGATRP